MKKSNESWETWNNDKRYGDLFYKRSIGELPEMESSKAIAKRIKGMIEPNNTILDVGCGAGHYLRSLLGTVDVPFAYTGVDATEYYIEQAKKAWNSNKNACFQQADISSLPFSDNSFDIVMCNNVFLHLPSIKIPLQELIRVSRKSILIRTLIFEQSYQIKMVASPEMEESYEKKLLPENVNTFDSDGNPRHFHFFNIYSESYIRAICGEVPSVSIKAIELDSDFNPDKINQTADELPAFDSTKVESGMQVSGCILQPWKFILLEKR
jgi:SAM-dependent methyltransferase